MIPQSHLSKLSNRLLREKGGRRINESELERDYCIAWFLIGLSRTPLRNKIIFKGGTALRRCYFSDYRFSEDLDFTLLDNLSFDELKIELELVYKEVKQASNITFNFSRPDDKPHQNCYTFYLTYEGPLPITSQKKEIKVDITLKEKLIYPPEEKAILTSYEEFSDLPTNETILVYSLHEIASEKTVALFDKARTEPRDLYDIWYLTIESESINLIECKNAIEEKLIYRGKTLNNISDEFNQKEINLKIKWENRLSKQMSDLPPFDNSYRATKRIFRQAKISKTD